MNGDHKKKKKKKNERKDFLRQLVWYLWLESHHVLGNNFTRIPRPDSCLGSEQKNLAARMMHNLIDTRSVAVIHEFLCKAGLVIDHNNFLATSVCAKLRATTSLVVHILNALLV